MAVKVKYVGQKDKLHVQFPVPYLSHSSHQGEMVFHRNVPQELKLEWAEQLVKTSPAIFKYVDDAVTSAPKKVAPGVESGA